MPDNVQGGEVVVTIGQQDIKFTQEQLGVNMDAQDNQILDAVRGMVAEELRGGLQDQEGDYTFAVRRALNSGTIYVYPKPGFGG